VMMSGHGTIETAVEATRLGAYDFIEKPISLAKLLLTVEIRSEEQIEAVETPPQLENVQYHHADYDQALGTAEPKAAQPVERHTPKVGRNDPCPCGSGKKYKHCHGKLS